MLYTIINIGSNKGSIYYFSYISSCSEVKEIRSLVFKVDNNSELIFKIFIFFGEFNVLVEVEVGAGFAVGDFLILNLHHSNITIDFRH